MPFEDLESLAKRASANLAAPDLPSAPTDWPGVQPLLWRRRTLASWRLLVLGVMALSLAYVSFNILASRRSTLAHGEPVEWLQFSPRGDLLLSGSQSHATVWRISDGSRLASHWSGAAQTLQHVFSSDGRHVFSSGVSDGARGEVTEWDGESGARIERTTTSPEWTGITALSPGGRLQAAVQLWPPVDPPAPGASGGTFSLQLWDIQCGRRLFRQPPTTHAIEALTFAPDGGLLADVTDEPAIHLRNTRSGRALPTIRNVSARALVFNHRGDSIAIAAKNDVLIFNFQTWKLPTGCPVQARALAFSPNDSMLAVATAGDESTVSLYDTKSGNLIREVSRREWPINALAFDPAGKRLAAGNSFGFVRLWTVE